MIVLTLSKCPPGLKGDVTRWLLEVNTGVYVGKLSARVRDLLWKRVCEYCGQGEATMIFSARNEQGFSFYIHNTTWRPTDFDGILLPKKPLPPKMEKTQRKETRKKKEDKKSGFKTRTTTKKIKQEKPVDYTPMILNGSESCPLDFVALDLETTGLKSESDSIIEVAAIRYKQGTKAGQYHALVKCDKDIPEEIIKLTGIDNELLERHGQLMETALKEVLDFMQDDIIVGHYISFDMLFLRKACGKLNLAFKQYRVIDTVALAKAYISEEIENYKLVTLVRRLGISDHQEHRALPDAGLAASLYLKLNENKKS